MRHRNETNVYFTSVIPFWVWIHIVYGVFHIFLYFDLPLPVSCLPLCKGHGGGHMDTEMLAWFLGAFLCTSSSSELQPKHISQEMDGILISI